MSTATEIEKAILSLPSEELDKLADWWARLDLADPAERARLEAIKETSGCLAGEESDDFADAVADAGGAVEEGNDW